MTRWTILSKRSKHPKPYTKARRCSILASEARNLQEASRYEFVARCGTNTKRAYSRRFFLPLLSVRQSLCRIESTTISGSNELDLASGSFACRCLSKSRTKTKSETNFAEWWHSIQGTVRSSPGTIRKAWRTSGAKEETADFICSAECTIESNRNNTRKAFDTEGGIACGERDSESTGAYEIWWTIYTRNWRVGCVRTTGWC